MSLWPYKVNSLDFSDIILLAHHTRLQSAIRFTEGIQGYEGRLRFPAAWPSNDWLLCPRLPVLAGRGVEGASASMPVCTLVPTTTGNVAVSPSISPTGRGCYSLSSRQIKPLSTDGLSPNSLTPAHRQANTGIVELIGEVKGVN